MFSTFKQRLLLAAYIFLILSIPVGAYLASEYQVFKSRASEGKQPIRTPFPSTSPLTSAPSKGGAAKELLSLSEDNAASQTSPAPEEPSPAEGSSPTLATSFGPTLSLKTVLDGRPTDNQSTKLFVGIIEGALTSNPKFLLSFSVNLHKDGTYTNLSLAGLSAGTRYTALLKGTTQIATASAFTMSPTVTNLNNGEAINMLTGDLNEDNAITASDYTIAQKAFGAVSSSSNWNENVDFNRDGVINLFDLAIISRNLGKVGASGAWTSPLPAVATASGSLAGDAGNTPPSGSPTGSKGGYWIWVPK